MRLIDAEKAEQKFVQMAESVNPRYRECILTMALYLRNEDDIPTVDAEPIRHGHWEHGEDVFGMYCQCSECGNQYYGSYEFKYCPNCGARMDAPTQKSVGKALKALEEEQ